MCIPFLNALAGAILALLTGATFFEAFSAGGVGGLEEVANALIASIVFWVASAEIKM